MHEVSSNKINNLTNKLSLNYTNLEVGVGIEENRRSTRDTLDVFNLYSTEPAKRDNLNGNLAGSDRHCLQHNSLPIAHLCNKHDVSPSIHDAPDRFKLPIPGYATRTPLVTS